MKNKYKLTIISAITHKEDTLFSFGNTAEEAVACALLRTNEATLEKETVLSVELVENNP